MRSCGVRIANRRHQTKSVDDDRYLSVGFSRAPRPVDGPLLRGLDRSRVSVQNEGQHRQSQKRSICGSSLRPGLLIQAPVSTFSTDGSLLEASFAQPQTPCLARALIPNRLHWPGGPMVNRPSRLSPLPPRISSQPVRNFRNRANRFAVDPSEFTMFSMVRKLVLKLLLSGITPIRPRSARPVAQHLAGVPPSFRNRFSQGLGSRTDFPWRH
jgi:hypothetical protein